MNSGTFPPSTIETIALNDCWNRIGVRGDSSCAELLVHIHCRNCPVYSAAAQKLLDMPASSDYSSAWTEHFAQPIGSVQAEFRSALIFRVGAEWMAVPSHLCIEVASARTVHSLPHRRNGAVLGVTNVRGVLLVCVSLAAILHVAADTAVQQKPSDASPGLLVLRWPDGAVAVPVDEVQGIQRFQERELQEVPATVAGAQSPFTTAVLRWGERSVGLLDEQLLGYTITRSLV